MSFGITELLVILAIVVLLFGTTKLKSLGSDLGSAIKGFKSAISEEDAKEDSRHESERLDADIKDATPTNQASEEKQKVEAGKD